MGLGGGGGVGQNGYDTEKKNKKSKISGVKKKVAAEVLGVANVG